MGDMDDRIVDEFLVESLENLDQLDRDLVALESDPSSHEHLQRIFRSVHTIKGTCGFLGFGRLESVAHVVSALGATAPAGTTHASPAPVRVGTVPVDGALQSVATLAEVKAAYEANAAVRETGTDLVATFLDTLDGN